MAGEFDDKLMEIVRSAVQPGDTVVTLGQGKPNLVVDVRRDGLLVETLASKDKGIGPQLVPAWMIITAWEHLVRAGSLSQPHLLNAFNVKRSAFVCALLARVDGVEVESSRPAVLRMNR